jgi:hypothetical protein
MEGKVYNPEIFLEWLRKTINNLRIVGVPVNFPRVIRLLIHKLFNKAFSTRQLYRVQWDGDY